MAQSFVLNAVERPDYGTRVARKLRKSGLVPAVIYGHKEANVAVSIKREEVTKAIRTGARLVEMKLGEKGLEKALIRDVQWDYLGAEVLHVDFARVGADERIEIEIRVELRGISPGIAHGGNLIQPLHTLHVECLVTNIPESIRVSINDLDLNQAIHVKELKLPEGVTVMNEADAIVVQVVPQQVEAEAPVVDTSEPEVIGRAKTDEEAAEEEKK